MLDFDMIRNVIVETLGCEVEAVVPEASLADDLGADSLDAVELMMALEEATGMTIAEEDTLKLVTVGDLMAYFEGKAQ